MGTNQDETIKCQRCSAANNASNRFCVACGAVLGADWQALERLVDERLTERVRLVLKENFADQKGLEIETSELIAERVVKWAKTFGYFFGIPVALAAIVITLGAGILGIIGLRTWSDIGAAQKELTVATTGLASARSQLDEAKTRAKEALADAETFKQQIKEDRELLASIPALQKRTKSLEELLKLDEFKKYLGATGLPVPDKLPSVKITDAEGVISYYDPSQQQIVMNEQAAKDPSVVLREYMHHVLYRQKDGNLIADDRMQQLYPVESFMAFYIPASFLNNPKIGNVYSKDQPQAYLYNLQGPSDVREYDKLKPEEQPYQGAEILGRLFWDFREAVGRDTSHKLVVGAWQEFSRRSATQSAKEFLTIFARQFDQGTAATYMSEVKRTYDAHNVKP